MANWASTSYAIEGPKETLQKIEQAILHHDVKEGSSDDWEGNVLKTLGIEWLDRSQDRENGLYMRGFIREDVEPWYTDKGTLRFDAEEAWGITDFNECLEKAFPDIKVYWVTEEPNCEVYATNDKKGRYFKEKYFVDTCIDGNYQSEYFIEEKAVFNWLSNLTKGSVKNHKDVEKFNADNERDDEDFISIHKFNVC